jgi:hypothetical protein
MFEDAGFTKVADTTAVSGGQRAGVRCRPSRPGRLMTPNRSCRGRGASVSRIAEVETVQGCTYHIRSWLDVSAPEHHKDGALDLTAVTGFIAGRKCA